VGRNYLRLPRVIEKYGLCRSAVYTLMPKPVKVGRASFWLEDECDAFMQSMVDASRKAGSNPQSA
jgi:predicted DNA-binding transcriptional regulator AlpA